MALEPRVRRRPTVSRKRSSWVEGTSVAVLAATWEPASLLLHSAWGWGRSQQPPAHPQPRGTLSPGPRARPAPFSVQIESKAHGVRPDASQKGKPASGSPPEVQHSWALPRGRARQGHSQP